MQLRGGAMSVHFVVGMVVSATSVSVLIRLPPVPAVAGVTASDIGAGAGAAAGAYAG